MVPGLGKLIVRKTPARPARKGRNPATGEEIMISAKPAGKKLVFRVAKAAKVAVLKK
jgi:DNA-binding protein HU-beta